MESERSELGLILAWGGCRAELAFEARFCKWLKGKEKRGENIFQRFVNGFGGTARGLVCVVFSIIRSGRLAAIVAEMVIECAGDNYTVGGLRRTSTPHKITPDASGEAPLGKSGNCFSSARRAETETTAQFRCGVGG